MTRETRGGPGALSAAIASVVAAQPQHALTRATGDLISIYRSGRPPETSVLETEVAALAYAAYRMPATYAAVREVLAAVVRRQPSLSPRTLLDVGGGTGAGAWAALATFPCLETVEVLDASKQALRIGRQLIDAQSGIAPGTITWRQASLPSAAPLPRADVVIVSYLMGELPEPARRTLLLNVADAAKTIVVVAPGTPAGFQHVLSARQQLIDLDRRILAPCPHENDCPLAATDDWCHFGVRLNRSPEHRRAKAAVLGHEDEKFTYLVATSEANPSPAADRIIRRPLQRKGLVEMRLCTSAGTAQPTTVSRRDGTLYRQARDSHWNGTWPPDQPQPPDHEPSPQ